MGQLQRPVRLLSCGLGLLGVSVLVHWYTLFLLFWRDDPWMAALPTVVLLCLAGVGSVVFIGVFVRVPELRLIAGTCLVFLLFVIYAHFGPMERGFQFRRERDLSERKYHILRVALHNSDYYLNMGEYYRDGAALLASFGHESVPSDIADGLYYHCDAQRNAYELYLVYGLGPQLYYDSADPAHRVHVEY